MKTFHTRFIKALLYILWLLFATPVKGQVLDSEMPIVGRAWAKVTDTQSDSVQRVYNDYLVSFLHNNHFRTAIAAHDSSISTWYDTAAISLRLQEVHQTPLKMQDFVYFDPLECFQYPLKVSLTKTRRPIRETLCCHRIWYYRSIKPSIVNHSVPTPIPYALRFYLDTAHIAAVPGQTRLYIGAEADLLPEPFLKPFYFSKYLVSNAEYREFVNYVKDSIARTLLYTAGMKQYGRIIPGMDEQGDETRMLMLDYSPFIFWGNEQVESLLAVMYLPENERYFRRKQIDSRILIYRSPTIASPTGTLSVYPDTSAWIRDFDESFFLPYERTYFWHPAYDHYPVVGVSYWQALAYLDWKTKMYQKELDKQGIRLRVVCDLPTEAEWDMVATAECVRGKPELYPSHYHELSDQSWITSLQLIRDKDEQIDSTAVTLWLIQQHPNLLTETFEGPSRTLVFRDRDDTCFCQPTGKDKKQKKDKKHPGLLMQPDPNGIFHMGSNVSVWLKDSYAEQWLPVFTKRQEMLCGFDSPEMDLLAQLEQYYNTLNHTNGRLVRGANWYDRRYFSLYGKNITGMQAKRFEAPENAHPTLGFRYVMRFESY